MALGTESSGGTWLSVSKGKIRRKVLEGTPGAIPRVLTKGKNAGETVYELYHNFINGKIERVYSNDGEHGKQWVFVINDGVELYNLPLNYLSGYAHSLLKRMPNVDFSREVKLRSHYIEGEDGISRGYFSVWQGDKIESAFTKDNPNGLPESKSVVVSGEKQWDSTEKMEFLEKLVTDKIMPRILIDNPLASQTPDNPEEEVPDPDISDIPPDKDDNDPLPF